MDFENSPTTQQPHTEQPEANRKGRKNNNRRRRQKPNFKTGNSAASHEEQRREKDAIAVMAKRKSENDKKFLGEFANLNISLPPDISIGPNQKRTRLMPVVTNGLGLIVSEVYNRYYTDFNANTLTIYALYRCTLAQFAFQVYKTDQCNTAYPSSSGFPADLQSVYRSTILANPYNFKIIAAIIDLFGKFSYHEYNWLTILPDRPLADPLALTFTRLPEFVIHYSRNIGLQPQNVLPGAIFRNGFLQNPHDFWPPGYNQLNLRQDFVHLKEALEMMKSKLENIVGKCNFDGHGKAAILACSDENLIVPYEFDADRVRVFARDKVFLSTQRFVRSRDDTDIYKPTTSRATAESAYAFGRNQLRRKRMSLVEEWRSKKIPDSPYWDVFDDIDDPPLKFRPKPVTSEQTVCWTPFHLSPIDMTVGVISRFGYVTQQFPPLWNLRKKECNAETHCLNWSSLVDMFTPCVLRDI